VANKPWVNMETRDKMPKDMTAMAIMTSISVNP
jgi:hypothetical protein